MFEADEDLLMDGEKIAAIVIFIPFMISVMATVGWTYHDA
jgi:hypothetical protein